MLLFLIMLSMKINSSRPGSICHFKVMNKVESWKIKRSLLFSNLIHVFRLLRILASGNFVDKANKPHTSNPSTNNSQKQPAKKPQNPKVNFKSNSSTSYRQESHVQLKTANLQNISKYQSKQTMWTSLELNSQERSII